MLSKDLENTLNQLFKDCSENKEEFVTIEHLLLMLTMEESARRIFESLSVDISSLQKEVKEYINKNVPKTKESKEIQPTLAFQRVLQERFFTFNPVGKLRFMEKTYLPQFFRKRKLCRLHSKQAKHQQIRCC